MLTHNITRALIDDGTATTTITCFSLDAHTFVPDCNLVVSSVEDKDTYHVPSILSQSEGHRYIFQYHFGKKANPGRPNFTLNVVLKLSTQPLLALPEPESTNTHLVKILEESSTSTDSPSITEGHLPTATAKDNVTEATKDLEKKRQYNEQEGIFCLGYKVLDNKFLGVQGAYGCILGSRKGVEDLREVSNDDTAVGQRRLEDKKREEKTNMDYLIKEQEKEYQTGWKIKTSNVFYSCNQKSIQQCIKSGVTKHLGVAVIQQQNGLVKE
nr:nucleic acid-binding, OB-fold protein [Tanacetum cinerariifolium]